MKVEVEFRNIRTRVIRVVVVPAKSTPEGIKDARAMLLRELKDKREFLEWGIASVRKLDDRTVRSRRGIDRAGEV